MLASCGYDAVGIDPNAPEGDSYQKVEFERAELPTPVDAVVACTSLHHVREPGEVVDKITQILAPGGAVVVVEWDWQRFDEATAQWCFERLDDSESWLRHRRDEWLASGGPWQRYLEAWTADHGLHGAETLLAELDRHLSRRDCERGAYFFPNLTDTDEADELAAIASGQIQANRLQYAGTRP